MWPHARMVILLGGWLLLVPRWPDRGESDPTWVEFIPYDTAAECEAARLTWEFHSEPGTPMLPEDVMRGHLRCIPTSPPKERERQ